LENNLLHLVAKDKDFGLDENDIAQLLDQSQYIGCAKIQTEEFLRGEVADTLARYEHLQAPESKLEV
jgi:adenylosuccinate lyase